MLTNGFSELGLFADLYELTMLQAYRAEGMTDTAVFTLFVRRLPQHRNFLIACGLQSVLEYLEHLRFSEEDLAYLRSIDRFTDDFVTALRDFRFTGDVYAVPEGTPIFANEPILEIVAPIAEGQFVETFVMNQMHVQMVLAAKAARVTVAARGRTVVDFGARRAHGIDAAVKAARAFYIAGVNATSNVLAGKHYGIPVAGTMAHSYVQAHDDEREAFRAFAKTFPGTVLLVDTYDTIEGIRRIIELAHSAPDVRIGAVRLDSGDLGSLARETRRLLDAAGLQDIEIFVSSGLDEHRIAALLAAGAPIDGFGVGTGMIVSDDAPTLDMAYKLSEYAGEGRTKLSANKPILPGRKQLFRNEREGVYVGDVLGVHGEPLEGHPLLGIVMRNGKQLPAAKEDLTSIRRRAAEQLAKLPARITALAPADPPYPVTISSALTRQHEAVRERTRTRHR
jgi:nicotinate phosphoribosyltransferase